jgi:hypothetical protein
MQPRMSTGLRVVVVCATVWLVTGFLLERAGANAHSTARVQASQQLAVLLATHRAYDSPKRNARQVSLLAASRPITGERTTLPVVGSSVSKGGVHWLRVMLPGRPNGATGWIEQQGTRRLERGWHLKVDLSRRSVSVYDGLHLRRSFRAVVGKPSTPTPTGTFFVEETVRLQAGEPGGPFALALSARSNVLQEFDGGPGQIAMHGRNDLGGTLGTAASHGCIRLDTAAIDWLAARIGPGTSVTIDQ